MILGLAGSVCCGASPEVRLSKSVATAEAARGRVQARKTDEPPKRFHGWLRVGGRGVPDLFYLVLPCSTLFYLVLTLLYIVWAWISRFLSWRG